MITGDDSQNYLVTVSDLMSGLIFIFIITLMIFVFQFQTATTRIQSAEQTRGRLLEILESELEDRGLEVNINTAQGILRLTDQSINFPQGSADPQVDHIRRVEILAEVLAEVLPCFVAVADGACERGDLDRERYAASVSVLMIEGHTDSLRVGDRSRFRSNLELAGGRAATIHRLLIGHAPSLAALRNQEGAQILSISGYGAQNPLIPEDPLDPRNRRIDLRFLMEAPEVILEPVEEVQDALTGDRR